MCIMLYRLPTANRLEERKYLVRRGDGELARDGLDEHVADGRTV